MRGCPRKLTPLTVVIKLVAEGKYIGELEQEGHPKNGRRVRGID